MVVVRVSCNRWVFVSLVTGAWAGKGLSTHAIPAPRRVPVSSAAAPGWLSLSKVCSCSAQPRASTCNLLNRSNVYPSQKTLFPYFFFLTQFSQMSGFVSHLHIIK